MNNYLKVLKSYAVFRGRASRSEFWMFFLFNIIFVIVAMILDNVLGTTFSMNGIKLPYGYLYLLYCLVIFIPGLAVTVRRLHDVGKSGWFYFVVLIPIAGGIWLLVLLASEGNMGDNKYGPNPNGNVNLGLS